MCSCLMVGLVAATVFGASIMHMTDRCEYIGLRLVNSIVRRQWRVVGLDALYDLDVCGQTEG